MNTEAKRLEIEKLYGSSRFHGKELKYMSEAQIHAIYGRMLHNGIFDEYESLKKSYVDLFPRDIYTARKRANGMSIFELRDVIPKVLASKKQQYELYYQFTIDDLLADMQGKEQKNEENS